MDLSVVIPVHNEADNVEPLAREIVDALGDVVEFEIIFVDDGSTDETPCRLRSAQHALPSRVRVLRHRKRCGQSAALWTGVAGARAPWVATLDGDGQNDPHDIPSLLVARDTHKAEAQPKLIAGQRARRHDSWLRRVSSRIANGVRRRLLGDGVTDTGCGLKLVERATFVGLPFFDHMHRFIPALVRRAGGGVLTVDVGHRPRQRGTSKYGVGNRLWVGITDLAGVAWLQRRMKRPEVEEETP